jgi:hypothetical protein
VQNSPSLLRSNRRSGALPGPRDLEAAIRAGRPWSKTRDIPDLVGWDDFTAFGDLALPALQARLGRFPAHATTHFFPVPKASPGKLRAIVCADPFDEAIYRAAVGDIAGIVDLRLGEEVRSYRLRRFLPTWELRNYKYGDAERRSRARGFVASPEFAGLAKVDGREYHGSIRLDVLGEVLRSELECPPDSVDVLLGLLYEWQETWGVRGMPVGPEASGILGNAMLFPLDRALREMGVSFSRFTDDVHVFLGPNDDWDLIHEVIVDAVGELGLTLNEDKTKVATSVVEARMLAGADRFLDGTDEILGNDRPEGLKRVRWMFDAEVERPDPSGRRVRYALSVFANTRDQHGLAAVTEQPRLRHIAPKQVGRYLAQLRSVEYDDEEWLVEQATIEAPSADVAGQYHLLLALRAGRRRLSRETGDRLREMALDESAGVRMALRVAAADAWAKADGWTPGAALAAARSVGDSQLRRALVLSARHGSSPSRRDLDRLLAFEDILPALAWVRGKAA